MKKIINLQNSRLQWTIARNFKHLCKAMHKHYDLFGETNECIDAIRSEVLKVSQQLNHSQMFAREVATYKENVIRGKSHYVCRIIDSKKLKVALHIAPANVVFHSHKHEGALNALLVVAGGIKVKQFSTGREKQRILKNNECSVGLKSLFNVHGLQLLEDVNVFFSIRSQVKTKSLFPLKVAFAYGLGLSMLPLYACSDFENDEELAVTEVSVLQQDSGMKDSMDEVVNHANKVRMQSTDDEVLYKAANLYRKAATQENPEAQYWLGLMYLKGMGITENSDEALKWVAESSENGYAPAKKLLDYILNHDEALDC